jgi:4-diphosphocytidyl-2-C-methyl-D-erythritol kinase
MHGGRHDPALVRRAADGTLHARALAKINLYLHVLGRRADGYHTLESLVTFADVGDDLSFQPGAALALAVNGSFAAELAGEGDNLILKAARLFAVAFPDARLGAFHLTKNLPVASGIGGGSSDAAAALRLLAHANSMPLDDARIMACAQSLGADVPVCLMGEPRIMRGIGHDLAPALMAGEAQPALLVNPAVPVSSRDVFTALGLKPGQNRQDAAQPPLDAAMPVLDLLAQRRNDLEAAAIALAPSIGTVLATLRAAPECRFARMSGSGATCFALFDTLDDAQKVAQSLKRAYPHWWIAHGRMRIPAQVG